jgi:hypothetical protein
VNDNTLASGGASAAPSPESVRPGSLLWDCLAALAAYDNLDEQRNKCEECEEQQELAPEACGECFPFAADARLKMRAALARARSEGVHIP